MRQDSTEAYRLYVQADTLTVHLWYKLRIQAIRHDWFARWERLYARAKARSGRRWQAYADALIDEVPE